MSEAEKKLVQEVYERITLRIKGSKIYGLSIEEIGESKFSVLASYYLGLNDGCANQYTYDKAIEELIKS